MLCRIQSLTICVLLQCFFVVILQAQVTFHGLSLYSTFTEVERSVERLELKNPGSIQQNYVAYRDGIRLDLGFIQLSSGELLLASIRTSSQANYTDYLARVAAYQHFYGRPPSIAAKPTEVLNFHMSTWSFYPPLATLFNLVYNPEKGIIGEVLHIDHYVLMQNQR